MTNDLLLQWQPCSSLFDCTHARVDVDLPSRTAAAAAGVPNLNLASMTHGKIPVQTRYPHITLHFM